MLKVENSLKFMLDSQEFPVALLRIAKMRSTVPPTHHHPEWPLLGWVIFLCTLLGSDWRYDYKVLKYVCQSVTATQKVILQLYDGMPISLYNAVLK